MTREISTSYRTQPIKIKGIMSPTSHFYHVFNRFIRTLSACFEFVSIAGFLMMMVITFIDVVGAKLFNQPIVGGIEFVFMLQVVAVAGAISATQIAQGHIRIDYFINRLPRLAQSYINALSALLMAGLFALIGWRSYLYGCNLMAAGQVTASVRIPLYPFTFWVALSCIPTCLVFITELINSMHERKKSK